MCRATVGEHFVQSAPGRIGLYQVIEIAVGIDVHFADITGDKFPGAVLVAPVGALAATIAILLIMIILIAVLGLVLLVAGGQVFVSGASGLSLALGVSQRVVGLTVAAIATAILLAIGASVGLQSVLANVLVTPFVAVIPVVGLTSLVVSPVAELGRKPGNAGFYLSAMSKTELFKTVILDGALPRKTFSMGEAWEKRFYMEARRLGPR